MSKKDAYRRKLEAQIDEQVAKVKQVKAKAKGKVAKKEVEAYQAVEAIEKRIGEARDKLAELAAAGEDTWETLKDGVEQLWDDVGKSAKKLFAKLG